MIARRWPEDEDRRDDEDLDEPEDPGGERRDLAAADVELDQLRGDRPGRW